MDNLTANVNVKVDPITKEEASIILKDLGLNMSTAINVFLRQIVINNGLPFEIKAPNPSRELQESLDEEEKIISEIKSGKRKPYKNMTDLINALNNDNQ